MKTKLILEIGYNHNGSEETARQMIDEAEELGAWGVKFQKWDIDGFPDWKKDEKKTGAHAYGKTYYQHRKALEFSVSQLKKLKKYAEKKGLVFICSGKDIESVRTLVEDLKLEWIKLPSQRYHDNKIFKYLMSAKKGTGLNIIVSTGMKTADEIYASKWPECADVFMHCVSKYPCTLQEADLGFMRSCDYYNGYSSHDEEGRAIPFAVLIGAEYVERHYTLDKKGKGSDHKISSDKSEIYDIIKEIEFMEIVLGNLNRNLTDEELRVRDIYSRF